MFKNEAKTSKKKKKTPPWLNIYLIWGTYTIKQKEKNGKEEMNIWDYILIAKFQWN